MFEIVLNNIKDSVPLNEQDAFLIKGAFKSVYLKKKQFLLREGEPSKHRRYIAVGCPKLYNR